MVRPVLWVHGIGGSSPLVPTMESEPVKGGAPVGSRLEPQGLGFESSAFRYVEHPSHGGKSALNIAAGFDSQMLR